MSNPEQPGQPGPEQPGQNPYPQQPPPPPQYGQQPPQYGQQPPQYGGAYGAPAGAPPAGDPGTLDLPYYGIGFPDAVKRAFQKYARFDGRASRSEFWWFALGLFLIFLGVGIVSAIAGAIDSSGVLSIVLYVVAWLAVIVPVLAIGVRRLHDGGFSGWLMLLYFVPMANLVLIVLWILPSKPEGAKYDRVPGGYGQPGGYAG